MTRNRNCIVGLTTLGIVGGLSVARAANPYRVQTDPASDYLRYGFARRELTTPAGHMTYYEAGTGRPIVFLHGIGGGASSWTWNKVAPAFTDNHRVIVPDFG